MDELKVSVMNVIATLMKEEPFFALLLKRTWILASDRVPTAATDGLRIYVNPKFFCKLKPEDQKALLLHELMHIVQLHKKRCEKYIKMGVPQELLNAVADAKANQYIEKYFTYTSIKPITPEMIENVFKVFEVREKSLEEIIDEIVKKGGKARNLRPTVDLVEEEEGTPVNEGDEEDMGKSKDDVERRVKKKIVEASVIAKSIGSLPAELERLVNEILRPKVDWRRLIRSAVVKGLGKRIRRTWSRPNKKLPDKLPGRETLRSGRVVVLVDTSGSISERELKQFVSEVYEVAREVANVVVIPWDATVYEPIAINSPSDVRRIKLRGGGGTVIGPALELVDRKFSNSDIIIILSDWHIYDLYSSERLLRKYSSKIIAVTTSAEPPEYLFRIRLDLSE